VAPSMYSVEHHGFTMAAVRLDAATCNALSGALPAPDARRGGVRNLLADPLVVSLLRSRAMRDILTPLLGPDACAVKATLFDKTPSANWKVPWHQDRAIAVATRIDTPGFGPWTRKRGVLHVEPPVRVLERMLAVRIHLDGCGDDNGPLRVLPGTHTLGALSAARTASLVAQLDAVTLAAPKGGILLLRPLLVHASSPARSPAHRRVLHVELAPAGAPAPLAWAASVALSD
jgi:ectoine hydroxylase-related dioxygenase (phytanoyl-CoA dioxygenase family)